MGTVKLKRRIVGRRSYKQSDSVVINVTMAIWRDSKMANDDRACTESVRGRVGHRFHAEGRRHKYLLAQARKQGKKGWNWPCGHRHNPKPKS